MRGSGQLGANQRGQANESVRVAPLVVVPRENLHQVADDLGLGCVEDRGVGVAHDVGGDDRIFGVLKNTLELALSSGLDRSLDSLNRDLLAGDKGQVGQRTGRGGNANSESVELTLELGQNQSNRLRAAARARRRSLWGASRTRWSPV